MGSLPNESNVCPDCGYPSKGGRCSNEECLLGEPTQVSQRPRNLVALARKPDPDLLEALATLTRRAESGELVGMTVLCNLGDGVCCYHAGDITLSDEIICWEDYKFLRMAKRNLKEQ